MAGVGARLKQAREARGLTLGEIAEETKIGLHQLEALEQGELGALPDPVFVRGFVRSYASAVGLDGDALAAEIDAPEAGGDVVAAMAERLGVKPPLSASRALILAGVVAAVLVVALGGLWLLWPRREPTPAPVERPAAAVKTEPVSEPVAEAAPVVAPEAAPVVAPEAAPVPAPPTEPAAQGRSGPIVEESGVGTAIVDRRLVGRGERFREGDEVWFWTRVVGAEAGSSIDHHWIREGATVGRARLRIGGPHWRTQSRRRLDPGSAGAWRVEARDEAGRLLASATFDCAPR